MTTEAFEPGLLGRMRTPPRKVAVLRASRIGDFLCTTPALRALRGALPDAELCVITLPLLRELVERLPYVDRYIAFPGFPGIAEQLFEPPRALQFLARMQAERFDLAVQMQGSGLYSNPLVLMMDARYSAGFICPAHSAGLLDAALPAPESGHEVDRMLALAAFLGAPARGRHIDFPLLPEDHATADRFLEGAARPLMGVHPGARDAARRWPMDRFLEAGLDLRRRAGGTLVVLADWEQAAEASRLAQAFGPPCLDLSDRLSLPVLGGVIQRLSLLLTNDSAPAHVAYVLGTPAVTVVGRGDAGRYAPLRDGPFSLLTRAGAPGPECQPGCLCLEKIPPQEAVSAGLKVLRTGAPTSSSR